MTLFIDKNTNDLEFDSENNLKIVSGIDEILQRIHLLMSTRSGEFFLDIDHGVNYDVILVKIPDLDRIRAEILISLNQEQEISNVDDLVIEFEKEKRKLKVEFTLTWTNGEITQNTLEEVI